jgi:type IV pilus biogenesis protein CpaD/CtpE
MTRNESKEGRSNKSPVLAVIAAALLAASLAGCATTGDFDGSASAEMPVDHGTGGGDQ